MAISRRQGAGIRAITSRNGDAIAGMATARPTGRPRDTAPLVPLAAMPMARPRDPVVDAPPVRRARRMGRVPLATARMTPMRSVPPVTAPPTRRRDRPSRARRDDRRPEARNVAPADPNP